MYGLTLLAFIFETVYMEKMFDRRGSRSEVFERRVPFCLNLSLCAHCHILRIHSSLVLVILY